MRDDGWLVIDNYRDYGMAAFPYHEWDAVVTCDEIGYSGGGTRFCRRRHA